MSLDINTERGQKSLRYEERATWLFEHNFKQLRYANTPKTGAAAVDAVVLSGNDVVGVVEQKSRNMTLEQLINWNYEWLVTAEKIEAGRTAGRLLGVPFMGFLYLIPDDLLLITQISDSKGIFTTPIRNEVTTTQKTINGGSIERENSFIDMTDARVYKDIS